MYIMFFASTKKHNTHIKVQMCIIVDYWSLASYVEIHTRRSSIKTAEGEEDSVPCSDIRLSLEDVC